MKHSTVLKLGMGISLFVGIIIGILLSGVTVNYIVNRFEHSPEWLAGYITGVNYQVADNISKGVMTGDGIWKPKYELAR